LSRHTEINQRAEALRRETPLFDRVRDNQIVVPEIGDPQVVSRPTGAESSRDCIVEAT